MQFYQISIHALRVEGDRSLYHRGRNATNFYPRPPGGGRLTLVSVSDCFSNFYPRPPGGGRLEMPQLRDVFHQISIHALRVEGDQGAFAAYAPSLRISIHALRVEGDDTMRWRFEPQNWHFYPRPPGGGRQQKRTKFSSVFAQKGEEFASLRRGKRKICRWCFKKDKFWVLIWCEGSGKSVCASASHCG